MVNVKGFGPCADHDAAPPRTWPRQTLFSNLAAILRGGILRDLCRLGFCLTILTAVPAAADDLRPLCPDRPGKGTSPCTVDESHFQIEMDAFDQTVQHIDGASIRTTILGNPLLKYGLSDTLDIEAGLAPYIEQHTPGQTLAGHGDLYLRGKWNFLGGPFAAVIEPFVKLATATRGLGDGALEEGVVLPLSYDLGGNWSLASTPEVDVLLNASGSGRHATVIDVIGLGRALDDSITLGAEAWTSQDCDPARVTAQYSFDLDGAWQPDSELQLDAGVNFGLNRNTPRTQIYLGVSRRL
jgi:hypothetical protein